MVDMEKRNAYTKKWKTIHKDRVQYTNKRSITKNFILKLATPEDIESIKAYVKKRENQFNSEMKQS